MGAAAGRSKPKKNGHGRITKNWPKGFRRQFFDGISGHVPASGVSGLKNLLADFAQKISEHGVRPAMSASAIVLPPVVRSAHPGGLKRSVGFITR